MSLIGLARHTARSGWLIAVGAAAALALTVIILIQLPDALARDENARRAERLQAQVQMVQATTVRASARLSDTRRQLHQTQDSRQRKQERLVKKRRGVDKLKKEVKSLNDRIEELGG